MSTNWDWIEADKSAHNQRVSCSSAFICSHLDSAGSTHRRQYRSYGLLEYDWPEHYYPNVSMVKYLLASEDSTRWSRLVWLLTKRYELTNMVFTQLLLRFISSKLKPNLFSFIKFHGAKTTVVQFHGLKHYRGPFSSIPRYCAHYRGQVCHSNHASKHGNGRDPKQSHDVFGHSTVQSPIQNNHCCNLWPNTHD
jgi:hypothetical protein